MPIPDPHVPQTERLQIGDHILSTSCVVVKRPDHHCGDDLVVALSLTQAYVAVSWLEDSEPRERVSCCRRAELLLIFTYLRRDG